MKRFLKIKQSLLTASLICTTFSARAEDSNSKGFFSFKVNANLVLNESIGYLYGSLGYGHNLFIKDKYFGFLAGYINIPIDGSPANVPDDGSSSDKPEKKAQKNNLLRFLNNYFLELKYGYEFLQKGIFSFGLDASLGFGLIRFEPAFSNTIGFFGTIKITDPLSAILQAGLQHHNQFHTINYIIDHQHFGPYVHAGIRYYLK